MTDTLAEKTMPRVFPTFGPVGAGSAPHDHGTGHLIISGAWSSAIS